MTSKALRHFRPSVQTLEDRLLPAATLTATLTPVGILRVEGTENADKLYINAGSNGLVSVRDTQIIVNGVKVSSVSATAVKSIEMFGLGGNDTINAETARIPSMIYGGAGNDTITGSSADDHIWGGDGNDTIYGRSGKDKLYGEAGHDKIFGEYGNDYLSGGPGRDEMVGGPGGTLGANYENFDTYHDIFDLSKPIWDTAAPLDIVQQDSSICQTLAALATMASQKGTAWIQSHIYYAGGSNFQVWLGGEQRWVNVTFDGTWTDNDAKPNGQDRFSPGSISEQPEFWVLLLTRARLSSFGVDMFRHYNDAAWEKINQNSGYRLKSSTNAVWQFTGEVAIYAEINQTTYEFVRRNLASGEYVIAASYKSSTPNALGIHGNHAYAVTRVFENNGVQYIELYNPWGFDAIGKTIDLAPGQIQPPKSDGYITLPWSEFVKPANFSYVYVV